MIQKELLDFLSELRVNNNRAWFDENRKRYQEVKKGFEHYVDTLIVKLNEFDETINGLSAKNCVFRIFRDVRFSKNKQPYKTNFGAYMCRGGRKSGYAGYYLHIEPGASFLGGGVYTPPSPNLKAIRTDIYENVEEFQEIISEPGFVNTYGELWGEDKLKSAPRGFDKNWEHLSLIQHKHYTVMRPVKDAELLSENFTDILMKDFKTMLPLNKFINYAFTERGL